MGKQTKGSPRFKPPSMQAMFERHVIGYWRSNKTRKLVAMKEDHIYVKTDVEMTYCDFCGRGECEGFESNFESPSETHKCDMQICYECVKQLNKIIPKKK